jgi:DNA polymerase III delta prime subunit
VQEVAALLLVDRARQRFGLEAPRPNLHMCFTGPPGTGKTTVALRMADLLHRLGYLEQGQVVHAMRDDLVGEYIGQTAPKTKRILANARSVRNELESARLRHAHRLASDPERNWTRDDLMRLEPADILPPGHGASTAPRSSATLG